MSGLPQPVIGETHDLGVVAPGRAEETILVVEDDKDVRSYAVSILRELGYRIFEAEDAKSALSIIEREPTIQLLFTDLGLPGGMDGRALRLRALEMKPSLKVLITTAYAGKALVHDGRLDVGIDLISKPFTFRALAARVREVFDRGEMSDD
jgi:CheY-like chemotaxis protein